LPRRQGQCLKRIAHGRQAIDQHIIVIGLDSGFRILALPFGRQRNRIIQDIPQAQHQAGTARLQGLKRGLEFATQSQRLLVNDEQVRARSS
jgi:hypothetical protein